MMVTFVSQCQKNALPKTRRVLDSFANRIGDCTWQTVITNDGLNAVKKLLRKTASKNTAVSCHWMRGRGRSEMIWIVGNRSKFNSQGIVPVNSTRKIIINTQYENDWHALPLIKALTALAALFHDWGKASVCFQNKLSSNKPISDPLRHEWVSLLLLTAFINGEQSDVAWLKRLIEGAIDEAAIQKVAKQQCQKPMTHLPNAANLIAWLVVTHHKLPFIKQEGDNDWRGQSAQDLHKMLKRITAEWGYKNQADETRLAQCFEFPQGLLSQSKPWLKQLQKWATKLHDCLPLLEQMMSNGSYRLVLHHARLSLMLGDHHYSSQGADKNWHQSLLLYANTEKNKDTGKSQPKQLLDEHLVGVAKQALNTAHLLPAFEDEPPFVYDVKTLKKKSKDEKFIWQDKAVEKIKAWKSQEHLTDSRYGFFAVNMASTGCGKTLANAKIMQALSKDGDSLRYALALGLRTLTLQTGDEYRSRIGLDNSELAVMIGSRAVMELHNQAQQINNKTEVINEQNGSESAEELWEDNEIDFDIPEQALSSLSTLWTNRRGIIDKRKQKFLYAPVLACTIDHLMAATETKRGGRYILPSLRLMSSDLVIDEIDDFDGDDLIAIGRLIHLAGMLGRKVMISSATIPPALAEGYFNAYQEGWRLFAATRSVKNHIGCAWMDEFTTNLETIQDAEITTRRSSYKTAHEQFIKKRSASLLKADKDNKPKRVAEIVTCSKPDGDEQTIEQYYFTTLQNAIIQQHQRHAKLETHSGKQVSFGVVRMANIKPCIELTYFLAEAKWPENIDIRVMAYHSQQVLLLRHEQEKHLDAVLKRNNPNTVFDNRVIREHLHNSLATQMIFILVATPVEEVGRDHDFDWAVVEPSSYRSIIQLAGRVLRHRQEPPKSPNIALMQYNLKALKGLNNVSPPQAYCHPGYEMGNHRLSTHDLTTLIPATQLLAINALPRIQCNAELQPATLFADLEHHCIQALLTSYQKVGPEALQGWLNGCWWLTALPQQLTPFRKQDQAYGQEQTLYDVPNEQGECKFVEKNPQGSPSVVEGAYKIDRVVLSQQALSRLWIQRDYGALLESHAEQNDWSLSYTALRYGEINVRIDENAIQSGQRYAYCESVGFWKK